MATEPLVVREFHLKMESPDLMSFVQHFTNQLWKEVVDHIPAADKTPELYLALRGKVEGELREHVAAMDLCGMSAFCDDAREVDPWPDADEASQ
ncbi:hypothetical protein FJZ36_05320 [Candidatus Poribacteria bacterium]|nr:hypothetical protein [Candidatus Poribacteria bacterium]